MTNVKVEFAVELSCDKCVEVVKSSLEDLKDVKILNIDLNKQQVIVETSLSTSTILEKIESTGRNAVLKGYEAKTGHLGAAVSELKDRCKGVIRFIQLDEETCLIDGAVSDLQKNQMHRFRIHEYGDLSNGYDSVGHIYKSSSDDEQVAGNIICQTADDDGSVTFRIENKEIKVRDIIGRSFVVSDDDQILSGAVIARSAGLFQNPKKLCQCDGLTIWNERNRRR
ncbi:CCS (predicted) [Pycnogonum litorale]